MWFSRQKYWSGVSLPSLMDSIDITKCLLTFDSNGKKKSVDKRWKESWERRVTGGKWPQKGQKEIESVAQNNVVGNYFQIEFEAWIQHSGKKLTQNCNSGIWNPLCTESGYILDIEERSSCHGGLGDEYGYHTEWQIRALEGQEEISEPQNCWWKF